MLCMHILYSILFVRNKPIGVRAQRLGLPDSHFCKNLLKVKAIAHTVFAHLQNIAIDITVQSDRVHAPASFEGSLHGKKRSYTVQGGSGGGGGGLKKGSKKQQKPAKTLQGSY